jgi:hypothetical protein
MEDTRHLEVVNFTNVDNEAFEGKWGGEITIIKAGETRPFPKFLAEHYCKHLVNKILIRGGFDWSNKILREPLEKKILGQAIKTTVEEVPQEPKEDVFPEQLKETLHANEPKGETPIFKDVPKEEESPFPDELKPKKRGKKVK